MSYVWCTPLTIQIHLIEYLHIGCHNFINLASMCPCFAVYFDTVSDYWSSHPGACYSCWQQNWLTWRRGNQWSSRGRDFTHYERIQGVINFVQLYLRRFKLARIGSRDLRGVFRQNALERLRSILFCAKSCFASNGTSLWLQRSRMFFLLQLSLFESKSSVRS